MQIDTVVYFQITDPKLFTYGVVRPLNAIENLTATSPVAFAIAASFSALARKIKASFSPSASRIADFFLPSAFKIASQGYTYCTSILCLCCRACRCL